MSEPETVTETRWGWVVKKDESSGSMWALMTYRFTKRHEAVQTTSHWDSHGWLTRLVEITSTYQVDADGSRDLITESWTVIEL